MSKIDMVSPELNPDNQADYWTKPVVVIESGTLLS